MSAPKVRFPYFANNPNMVSAFQAQFGEKFKIDNNGYILSKSLQYSPLKMGFEIEISDGNCSEVARKLLDSIPLNVISIINENTKDLIHTPPKIFDKLGIHSEYKKHIAEFYMNPSLRQNILAEKILPILIQYTPIKYIVPVSVDVTYQQSIFSFLKMHTLLKIHGKEKLEELVFEDEVFSAIEMKGAMPVLTFVDCLMQNGPIALTMPISILGTSWHFYAMGPLLISHELSSSFFSNFQSDLKPLIDERAFLSLSGERDEKYTWRMLRFAVAGINKILSYANHFNNFSLEDGDIDTLRQMQFFGALHLMFADINSMNSTTDEYTRTSLAFNFIYKMANLCRSQTKTSAKDNDFVGALLSSEMQKNIISLLGIELNAVPDLQKELISTIDQTYASFHDKLTRIFPYDENENVRLWKFKSFRNYYAHGTFLEEERFGEIFAYTKGAIPYEIVYLPHALLLGMACDPKKIFDFAAKQAILLKQAR